MAAVSAVSAVSRAVASLAPSGHPSLGVPSGRPSGASVIARYPAPPTASWGAPAYAVRVLLRRYELRSELELLRRRRSPDVSLYEAALEAHDAKAYRNGLAIAAALLALATVLLFLPVILRFARAD